MRRSISMAVLHARRGKAVRRFAGSTPQSKVLLRRRRAVAHLRAETRAACQAPPPFDGAAARLATRADCLLPPLRGQEGANDCCLKPAKSFCTKGRVHVTSRTRHLQPFAQDGFKINPGLARLSTKNVAAFSDIGEVQSRGADRGGFHMVTAVRCGPSA